MLDNHSLNQPNLAVHCPGRTSSNLLSVQNWAPLQFSPAPAPPSPAPGIARPAKLQLNVFRRPSTIPPNFTTFPIPQKHRHLSSALVKPTIKMSQVPPSQPPRRGPPQDLEGRMDRPNPPNFRETPNARFARGVADDGKYSILTREIKEQALWRKN